MKILKFLHKILLQDEEFEVRRRAEKKKCADNVIANGRKQHYAANILQKNVFEKIYPIVDNTDREVARVTAERNSEADAREAEAMEAKKKIAQGLNDYYHNDYRK